MPPLLLNENFDDASQEQWRALVEKVLKGADFDKRLVSKSDDGLPIAPLYTRADALAEAETAVPGAPPFSRGRSCKRDEGGWDIRQLHIETEPEALNQALLEDLSGSVTSLSVQIAAPGQPGLPCDPKAMIEALKDIDLSICPVALQAGENFGAASAYLLGGWALGKVDKAERKGAFGADPLGTLAGVGALSQPLPQAMDGAIALVSKTQDMPQVTALIADGRPYHAAGASEAQELAVMLATLVAYLRAAESAGIAPEQALPKIAIALAADADQFLSIAKLRAARALIWRVAEAAGIGAAAARCHITATTSWRMLSKRDPWVNMLRTTIACAAAAMGGADAIQVLPYTAALGKADSFARRIARNTQIVLQEESSLGRVIDPAGGSWYVEKLTDDLAKAAWAIFQDIEAKGGMANALRTGFVQETIAATAGLRKARIATGRMPVTGVSTYPKLGDDGVTNEPLEAGAPAPTGGAVVTPLEFSRLAEPFEALRDAADRIADQTGKPPQVFLANLGTPAEFSPRSNWARNFFAAGGIEALTNDGFTNSTEVGAAFTASGAKLACICSSDDIYGELAEAVASLLKTAGATHLYLAGCPRNQEAALKVAGVDEFIYAGCDMLTTLSTAQSKLLA